MKRAILLFSLVLAVTTAPAQTAWVQRYSGPGNSDSHATAIVLDSSNNVVVTGYSTNAASGYDFATIKYSSVGSPVWTNRYNGPANGDDQASAVVVDTTNNVIVTGVSGSAPNGDFVTIKYSSAGAPLWTNRYNGPANGDDYAWAMVRDASNNVIVAGSSWNGTAYDYATIKYSGAGVPVWTNRYNAPANDNDQASAVAVDASNNVIVTGYSGNGTDNDYTTIKYSTAGVPLWTNRYDGPANGDDYAYSLVVDASNNIVVTGSSWNGTDNDYATIKYSGTGVPLWTNRYDGPATGDDQASALAMDASNNVIVTGFSTGSGGYKDYATIQYSNNGVPLWTNRYNGPANGDDIPYALRVDATNNVVVTGRSGADPNGDYATIKYSSAGVLFAISRYNGPGNGDDQPNALAVDRSGNVFATGTSWNGTNFDYATIKCAFLPPPIPLSIQKLNNQLVLSWTSAAFSLQSAPAITATFTNVPGATNPYTNPITGAQNFFRLISK